MEKVTLCYCANRTMHIPLCVSLYTALTHLNPDFYLDAYVFHDDLREKEIGEIKRCLRKAGREHSFEARKIDLSRFASLDSLHGDYMAWGRLLLPQLLPDKRRLIYYDADTLICTDLAEMEREDMNGFALGAVSGGNLKTALENDFYRAEGLDLEAEAFYSGGLLFDVQKWNDQNWTERVLAIARESGDEYKVQDQTAFNVAFHERFRSLPAKFNRMAHASGRELTDKEANKVVHFVGSPKPWDLFGSFFHDHHEYFDRYADRAGVENSFWHKLHWKNIKRTLQISRSYYGHAKKKWERTR